MATIVDPKEKQERIRKDIKNRPFYTDLPNSVYPDQAESIAKGIDAGTVLSTGVQLVRYQIVKELIKSGKPLMPWQDQRVKPMKTKTEDLILQPRQIDNSQIFVPIQFPKSRISIVDIDADINEGVELQWIPKTVSIKPENKLVAIASIGRNNPFYHYAGSEDTVEFTIDWFFTNDESRTKALKSARWLESLSKSSGYEELHRVKLIWGGSGIFENCYFLIEHAGYEMSNWVDWGFNKPEQKKAKDLFGNPKYFGLLPQQITQEIRLKKVTEFNLTYADMRSSSNGPVGNQYAENTSFIIPT